METAGRLRLADVFVSIQDPRQIAKVEHDLVELLVVAVNAVLVGADSFVEIELWAKEKLDWLRGYLRLTHGIPSHDTFGRLFGLIDADQFEAAFRRWVSSVLPALGAEIVAIDGKTSRRSGGVDATALHLVSAFAAGAGLVLGQRATAEKSNEITAIPELLSTLSLAGCTVTIDAMGTQTAIAAAIQERGADYVLAVKDNQPKLAESIEDFWTSFRAHPAAHTPHSFCESVEKGHGRIETRRCYVFDQLDCLYKPQQWQGVRSFVVLESERLIGDKTTREQRVYISSMAADAQKISHAIRSHWTVENRLHWIMDVSLNDDQMRARTKAAAHTELKNPKIAAQLLKELGRAIPARRRNRDAVLAQPAELANDPLSHANLEAMRRKEGEIEFATLGSGNHFLELQADGEDRLWLMVHSGSRALGQTIRDHHLARAMPVDGRLRALDAGSDAGKEYLHDALWARQFAAASRKAMAEEAGKVLSQTLKCGLNWVTMIATDHNHVALERHGGRELWVHRKGAMSAQQGETGVLPGSMGTLSFHVEGRGCEEALC